MEVIKFKKTMIATSVFALTTASNVFAGGEMPPPEELWKVIQAQQKQIEALQQSLEAVRQEAGLARQGVAQNRTQLEETKATVDGGQEAIEAISESLEASEEALKSAAKPRTQIGGYGELHYNNLSADDSARDLERFDFHRFVLFFNHDFNERVRFVSELELEHALVQDTADGSNGGEVELEQAYIDFLINDKLTAKAGLFLIPVGILNETHEPPTFYGVERNNIENVIIPSTWWAAGAGLSGIFGTGFSWDLALHSGLKMPVDGSSAFRVRSGRQKVSNAVGSDLAITGRLKYTGIRGLELAATVQHQFDPSQFEDDGLDSGTLFETHAIYQYQQFAIRALYAHWTFDGNAVEAADDDEQSGWYVEPSYRINEKFGVFARYEDVEGARSQDEFNEWVIGFNYWPHENVVLKFDYRGRDHDLASQQGRDFDGFDLGVGYQF